MKNSMVKMEQLQTENSALERDAARAEFYKSADRGEPMHWRDMGPDEVWNAAWEVATKVAQFVRRGKK